MNPTPHASKPTAAPLPPRPRHRRARAALRCALWAVLTGLTACSGVRPETPAPLGHARLLRMEECPGHTLVEIRNPWDSTSLLHRYLLLPADAPLPDPKPQATVLRVPLRRCAAFSAVHAALALQLGAARCVAGVCEPEYIVSPALRRQPFANFGSAIQPNIERLLQARCDALLFSPFENGSTAALERTGIPLVACADYMESTPLGRAEWMRFYGRLWGVGQRADSLFRRQVEAYEALARRADSLEHHPSLLIDKKEGGTWYVPGGKSYLAALYADAGARYLFAHRPEAGSAALDFETVFAQGREADVWVVKYAAPQPLTYTALAQENPAYARLAAHRNRRIYGCNTLRVPYYEELPFAPARLLEEWLHLLHPELPLPPNRFFLPLD